MSQSENMVLVGTGALIESLLKGEFICKTTNEDGWRALQTPATRERVETYLNQLNRTLASAADGEVFFCGYLQLGEAERKVISSQFREICSALIPLVEWLVLVQEASGQDAPLTEGAAIRLTELQSRIEDTPAFREQLAKLSQYRLFGSTSTQADAQIKLVFRRLVELGYLVRPNSEKQIYLATGKLDYLYEVIRFIDETEGLQLEAQAETASSQRELI
ncbi:condensin complex protein MksE [Shewanella sp. GXUN23E]|uniref:condensin complex protein MksE n=1 Tax=Shewanella sp. GXUN23E TaxID=3422498 RepID=UPI003D7E1E46